MVFNKTLYEILKNVVLESKARKTYSSIMSLKLDSNAKCLEILKEVANVDPTNIEEYVIEMQNIPKTLNDIDTSGERYETRPSSHMNSLLENLNEDQTKDVQFYKKGKRADGEIATKIEVFKMGLILIEKFKNQENGNTANAVENRYTANKKTNKFDAKNARKITRRGHQFTTTNTAIRTQTRKTRKAETSVSKNERQDRTKDSGQVALTKARTTRCRTQGHGDGPEVTLSK